MSISRTLHLPEDVVKKYSIINILGNHTMVIENFKAIMEYRSDYIKIKAKDKIISVYGTKIIIEYYNTEEIKISGNMNQIFFEVSGD
ncbi:MAG: YabP/YqfC family sporulation protein [Lachnospiraceae bacterium]